MDELVRRLAQNEWLAEQGRKHAEVSWRSAWWETTLALADVSDVSEAYDAAISELGQSRSYLAQRRRVGVAVDPACRAEAHKLPPAFSIEWVREGRNRIDRAGVKAILAAEEDHVSTRQFVEEIARPAVRRTPVAPPRVVEPVSPPSSWTPARQAEPEPEIRPVPEPDQSSTFVPLPPPRPTPIRQDGNGSRPTFNPSMPPPPAQAALSAALSEIEAVNRAMTRLEELIPKLDDETRPPFRAKLLELDVRVQMMTEGLNPESRMTFSDQDARELLG